MIRILWALGGFVLGGGGKAAYDYFTRRDTKSEERGEQRAKASAKAEYEAKLSQFEAAMREVRKEDKRSRDTLLAISTVGYAYAAACAGSLSIEVRTQIDEFVSGQMGDYLPASFRNALNEVSSNPPGVATAYKAACQLAPDVIDKCDLVIDLLTEEFQWSRSCDGQTFRSAWQNMKAAA